MKSRKSTMVLLWALVVINGLAGVVWTLGALGVITGESSVDLLQLAIGVINLVAGVIWSFRAWIELQRVRDKG